MILDNAWIEDLAKHYDDGEVDGKEYCLESQIFESIKEMGSPPLSLTRDILVDITK